MTLFTFPALGTQGNRFQTIEALQAEVRRAIAAAFAEIGEDIRLVGEWAASSGAFPTSPTPTAGSTWIVTDAGTVDAIAFIAGDKLTALGGGGVTYAGNWLRIPRADLPEPLPQTSGGTGASSLGAATVTPTDGTTDALADHLARTRALESEARTDLAAGVKVYSPIYHPARGLRISEFLTTHAAFTEQTAALQAAVNALMSSSLYFGLDLEGRIVSVIDTVNVDYALNAGGAFNSGKWIANGAVHAPAGWIGGVSDPIFDIFATGGARIERLKFLNLRLHCNRRCSGFKMTGQHYQVLFGGLVITDPETFGIRTDSTGVTSVGSQIKDCYIERTDATSTMATRPTIGLDLIADGDWKIFGNTIAYCKTSLQMDGVSNLVHGNHFYQGNEGTGPFSDFNPVITIPVRSNSSFVGNYIDNGFVYMQESFRGTQTATTHGYVAFTGNIFTLKAATAGVPFFRWYPNGANRRLEHMFITNNQFRAFGGETQTNAFDYDVGAGRTVDVNGTRNCKIDDNFFWGEARAQTTHPIYNIALASPTTSYAIDMTNDTAFQMNVNHVHSIAASIGTVGTGSPGELWYERTGGKTGNLRLDTARNGTATIRFDVNNFTQF